MWHNTDVLFPACAQASAGGLLLLAFFCPGSGLGRHQDSEQYLLPRIEQETNPVKRAKYEIRLGRLKLQQAISAFDEGRLEESQKLLATYVERIRSSWQTLQGSGRHASRQSQGFKDLDIALREDARLLDDLKHRVPYMDRDPVEKAAQEVERIRTEVLHALFPGERPAARLNRPLPLAYRSSSKGRRT